MSLVVQTPLPLLPAFDDTMTAPSPPKRSRGSSEALNRRVRANLNVLSIPDMRPGAPGAAPLRLQLQPQGTSLAGTSFEKILLGGAMRNKASKAHLILNTSPSRKQKLQLLSKKPLPLTSNRRVLSGPPPSSMMHRGNSSPLSVKKNANVSLLSLRMAAMLKGSTDAKAQLKFGGSLAGKHSFQAPGRTRSSPYQPSRNIVNMRTRSFNALCA